MNANVDQCGIVTMLRQLIKKGVITRKEGESIAARIAAGSGSSIILSI